MAMFNKTKDETGTEARVNTVIGEGTRIQGTLTVQGSVVVHGEVEGSLNATESIIVGKTGNLKAGLSARDALVSGKVKGKIVAKERVELQTGARLEGDVFAKSFMIEEGVFFQGNCSMGEEPVEATDDAAASPKSPPDLGLLGRR